MKREREADIASAGDSDSTVSSCPPTACDSDGCDSPRTVLFAMVRDSSFAAGSRRATVLEDTDDDDCGSDAASDNSRSKRSKLELSSNPTCQRPVSDAVDDLSSSDSILSKCTARPGVKAVEDIPAAAEGVSDAAAGQRAASSAESIDRASPTSTDVFVDSDDDSDEWSCDGDSDEFDDDDNDDGSLVRPIAMFPGDVPSGHCRRLPEDAKHFRPIACEGDDRVNGSAEAVSLKRPITCDADDCLRSKRTCWAHLESEPAAAPESKQSIVDACVLRSKQATDSRTPDKSPNSKTDPSCSQSQESSPVSSRGSTSSAQQVLPTNCSRSSSSKQESSHTAAGVSSCTPNRVPLQDESQQTFVQYAATHYKPLLPDHFMQSPRFLQDCGFMCTFFDGSPQSRASWPPSSSCSSASSPNLPSALQLTSVFTDDSTSSALFVDVFASPKDAHADDSDCSSSSVSADEFHCFIFDGRRFCHVSC